MTPWWTPLNSRLSVNAKQMFNLRCVESCFLLMEVGENRRGAPVTLVRSEARQLRGRRGQEKGGARTPCSCRRLRKQMVLTSIDFFCEPVRTRVDGVA